MHVSFFRTSTRDSVKALSQGRTECISNLDLILSSRLVFLEELSQVLFSLVQLLPECPSVGLPFLRFLWVLMMWSAQPKDLSPLCSEKDKEVLDLKQNLWTWTGYEVHAHPRARWVLSLEDC